MITLTSDQLDREVAYILKGHIGKDRPVDRWDFVRRIFGEGADLPRSDNNPQDRRIRDSVERLRPDLLICDLADGKGRYLASTYAEYMEFRSKYISHALPIMETARKMDAAALRRFPDEYREYRRNSLQPELPLGL